MRLFKEDCFLTDRAQEVVDRFAELGIDRDLTIEILAKTWPEKDVWEIDDELRAYRIQN